MPSLRLRSALYTLFVSLLMLTPMLGCEGGDDDDGNAPPAVNVSGNFAGTVSDSIAGNGTLTLSLSQNGNNVSGTFQSRFANPASNNSGSVNGTVSGTTLELTVTPSNPNSCPFRVVGQATGTQATGTYAAFNCSAAVSGTVTLTRQ